MVIPLKWFMGAIASCLIVVTGQAAFAQNIDKGLEAFENGDFETALQEWRPLAEQGTARAQNNLGALYANGQGVPQDYVEAIKWYRLAAGQGDAWAQVSLGWMYEEGEGVPQDYVEAVKWFRLAVEQGDASAQASLGWMYKEDEGVPQDFVFAHMWYNISASNGHENAKSNRDNLALLMTAEDISKAQRMARECVERDYNDC